MWMPEPRIKRYALVPTAGEDGVRRFQLARVESASGSVPAAERLERMEEIAGLVVNHERALGVGNPGEVARRASGRIRGRARAPPGRFLRRVAHGVEQRAVIGADDADVGERRAEREADDAVRPGLPGEGEPDGSPGVGAIGTAACVEANRVGALGLRLRPGETAPDIVAGERRRGEGAGLGADGALALVGAAEAEGVLAGHEEIRHAFGDRPLGAGRPGPRLRPRPGVARQRIAVSPVLEVAEGGAVVRRALAAQGGAVLADVGGRLGRAVAGAQSQAG
jgi:hypothetical protein